MQRSDGSGTASRASSATMATCTTDSCDPTLGCLFVAPDALCADANPCTTDTCDPTTGCANKPVRQGWDATHEILECPGQATWDASRTWCAGNGGVLAFPTNDLQRGALSAFAAKPGVTPALLAPLQQLGGGVNPWTWTDNGGSGEPPWCSGAPDEQSPPEDCGEFVTGASCTNDVGCSLTRSFACSIDIHDSQAFAALQTEDIHPTLPTAPTAERTRRRVVGRADKDRARQGRRAAIRRAAWRPRVTRPGRGLRA